MKIFARHELVRSLLPGAEPALLLEGAWPADDHNQGRWSLDEWIDAGHAWIDDEASRLAERAAHGLAGEMTLAYLNILPLRYYLVKLLRVVAAFKNAEIQAAETLEVHLTRERDEDYADVLTDLAGRDTCRLQIHWHDGALQKKENPPHNPFWRRCAGEMQRWMQAAANPRGEGDRSASRPHVVLCGNPRILNPICAELVQRGTRVWWLYDRFAVGTWRRWRREGVAQLLCNSSLGRTHLFTEGYSPTRLVSRNVDLTPAVDRWLNRLAGEVGGAQSRLLEQINRHFADVRPDALVVDEDATPLPRAAIAIGGPLGIPSLVVQHGVPCVKFGFAPLAADRVCAWDAGSQRQLERWGIAAERIVVTGSSQEKSLQPLAQHRQHRSRNAGPHLLLLATVPPSDDRPEPATFHLTRQTYAGMLRLACAAAARIAGARLTVKLHPRAQDPSHVQQAAAEFPTLALRIDRTQSLTSLLADCDCVLSCVSSSGVEAAAMGVPVIQLLPVGSGDILPAEDFGLIGSARTQEELDALLNQALSQSRRLNTNISTFSAVQQIVDVILGIEHYEQVAGKDPRVAAPTLV